VLIAVPPRAATEHPLITGQALTLLHRIKPNRKQALRDYLNKLGTNIRLAEGFDFHALTLVHFLRWVVIDDVDDPEAGALMFESNYDGLAEEHLAELLSHGKVAVHRIYAHCAGYPIAGDSLEEKDLSAVTTFLGEHAICHEAFHVAHHGKSKHRIVAEAHARDEIQAFLNSVQRQADWVALPPGAKYDAIRERLKARQLLAPLLAPAPPPPVSSDFAWIARVASIALPLLPVLVVAFPILGPVLLRKEKTDRADPLPFIPREVRELSKREDLQVQNQLTHVVAVKPGLFRLLLVRGVLRSINLLARFKYNQGSLGGITTIHFARWVLIENGRRLIFFSNYDGSWESYLGDFIDKASAGLTSIWSNTEGFPKTKCLVREGARDEDNFKAWTRSHQVPTQLWYSAYPELTVRNIRQNSRICDGLVTRPAHAEAVRAWLAML
jgi:hypothetical protein